MRKVTLVLFVCLSVVLVLALVMSSPAGAQSGDPWGALITAEAQATIDALNANAAAGDAASQAAAARARAAQLEAQAAQQSAAATRQAAYNAENNARAQATVNAVILATEAAQRAQATQAALDAIATKDAQSAQATAQAMNATATAQAQSAEATRAAQSVALAEIQRRSNFGLLLLYIAGALALAGCAWVFRSWALALARRVAQPAKPTPTTATPYPAAATPAGNVIIDATPILPQPNGRGFEVRVINDDRITQAALDWWNRQDELYNEVSE